MPAAVEGSTRRQHFIPTTNLFSALEFSAGVLVPVKVMRTLLIHHDDFTDTNWDGFHSNQPHQDLASTSIDGVGQCHISGKAVPLVGCLPAENGTQQIGCAGEQAAYERQAADQTCQHILIGIKQAVVDCSTSRPGNLLLQVQLIAGSEL